MKTQEELNALKEEVETLKKKLHELTEEELSLVSGGRYFNPECEMYDIIFAQQYAYIDDNSAQSRSH